MGFATNAIHVGQEPDPATGAVVAPIYQTSTYVYEELGKHKGYDYARSNHPNRKALERTVAKLEGGHSAYVFTSGMAAIDAVFRLFRPGDHIVLSEAVYGGVYRLSTQLLVHFGLEFSFVDTSIPACVLVRDAAEYEADLHRDAYESDDASDRHRSHRQTGERAKRYVGGRQHISESLLAAAHRAGGADRRAFDDEVLERAQRFDRAERWC